MLYTYCVGHLHYLATWPQLAGKSSYVGMIKAAKYISVFLLLTQDTCFIIFFCRFSLGETGCNCSAEHSDPRSVINSQKRAVGYQYLFFKFCVKKQSKWIVLRRNGILSFGKELNHVSRLRLTKNHRTNHFRLLSCIKFSTSICEPLFDKQKRLFQMHFKFKFN